MHVNYSNPLSHKLLTHEQEVSLAQKIEKGDKSARDMMIQSNLRLAFSIAKKYFNKGFDSDDLLQESNIGLIKAVDRYDWRKGFRFSTCDVGARACVCVCVKRQQTAHEAFLW